MRHIRKSFQGVQALKGVSLELQEGETLAVAGENGAGKSTLIKILGGALEADEGEMYLSGRQPELKDPHATQSAGISIIYQELNLIPELTVRENIFLGRERTRYGFIDRESELTAAKSLFERIGISIDPNAKCSDLTIAQQQIVEIAKALSIEARIIVMDEPTAPLTQQEVELLFRVIEELKSRKIGIIYISHRLEEIFQIADRVLTLCDGTLVDDSPTKGITKESLIEKMVGRPIESEFPKRASVLGKTRLRIENLGRKGVVEDVSFSVRAGEVVGFAGLIGSGKTELTRLIFGADEHDSGSIFVEDKEVFISSPKDAISHGICLLTEDRKNQGLILQRSVVENFGLPNLRSFSSRGFLDKKQEQSIYLQFESDLKIKTSDPTQPVVTLSGGNQQKVVLAKWLARNADIIIFNEPTRGIDVGAKYEIYLLINRLAEKGKAIILVSSELSEILGMCDRIFAMGNGRIKGEISDPQNATQEQILSMAVS